MRNLRRRLCPFFFLPLLLMLGGLACCLYPDTALAAAAGQESAQPQPAPTPGRKSLRQLGKETQSFYGEPLPMRTVARDGAATGSLRPAQVLLFGFSLVALVGLVSWKLLRPPLGPAGKPLSATEAAGASPSLLAEEDSVAEFAAAFRLGPQTAPSGLQPSKPDSRSGPAPELPADLSPEFTALKEFLSSAPGLVQSLRQLLQEIGRPQQEPQRQAMLTQLHGQLHQLKGMAALPELRPVWQLAYALECLAKQLTEKLERVTPSTLRTVAAGVDLLQELCRPGLRPDLCTNPPLRILAVDDEPLSRHALAFALKKALSPPDLAVDGSAALALAAKQAYDVIFLDVQMPGMDGYELCSRIHVTEPNQATPVVFVTVHNDFSARAKSTLAGGSDLLAKPFLTFELTVKALTQALRRRLQENAPGTVPASSSATTVAQAPQEANLRTSAEKPGQEDQRVPANKAAPATALPHPVPAQPAAENLAPALSPQLSAHLKALRTLAQEISQVAQEDLRQKMLAELFLHLQTVNAGLATRPTAMVLSSTLAGLLKKLLENPRNSTASALQSVTVAVDLLGDLGTREVPADLATRPPIRLLVVDDDPISRRAMSSALQMAFEKPDSAGDGEEALALAAQHAYDAIFLDIEMPGMDGHTACLRIRETAANQETPVVFVTGHTDLKSRTQSSLAGGTDFIAKPILKSEVTLKALAFALRRRLKEFEKAQALG